MKAYNTIFFRSFIALSVSLLLIQCSDTDEVDNRNARQKIEDKIDSLERPKNKYKFDLKTKFKEKFDLRAIKKGIDKCLEVDNWGEVVEFSEDYQVWIQNLKYTPINKNLNKVEFQLSLVKNEGVFKKNKEIKNKLLEVEYNPNAEWIRRQKELDTSGLANFFEKSTKEIGDSKGINGKITAASKTLGKLAEITRKELGLNNNKDIVQTYIVAGYAYVKLNEWINKLESNETN